MTPEKMTQWCVKVVPGGRSLVLAHDQAVGQPLVVATWTREDVDECIEQNKSVGAQVLDAAQDHSDSVGESCRFTLSWRNDVGITLRSIIHRAQPSERPTHEGALHAEFVSPNAMIGQLLNHISTQQRVINGSIGAVLSAYERALTMQQKTIEAQSGLVTALQANVMPSIGAEMSSELAAIKVDAWRKIAGVMPDVIRFAIAKFSGPDNDNDDDEATDIVPAAASGNGADHVSPS